MKKSQKTLFISDLHLHENQQEITRQFLLFLKKCDSTFDALYILGDLFDVWIGDDEQNPFQQNIIQAFLSLTKTGFPIYFLHGNRDFLIEKKFLQSTGIKKIVDQEKISLYGKSILLMHGDALCTRDLAYMKARKIIRNAFFQKLFLWLPLFIRKKIANKIRNKSMQHTQSTPFEIMDVTQEEVERVMAINSVLCLIHGHTHRPDSHSFFLNNKPAERIVLGAWHDVNAKILICDDSGDMKLISLNDFISTTGQNYEFAKS